MKKYIVLLIGLLSSCISFSQTNLLIHNSGNIIFHKDIGIIDSIKFKNNISSFNLNGDSVFQIPVFSVDSITFGSVSIDTVYSNIVYIFYNDTTVNVINPMESKGISVLVNTCDVTVNANSGIQDIEYYISGTTAEGSLVIHSDKRFTLTMNGITLNNADGPVIESTLDSKMTVNLLDNSYNTLIDGTASLKKAVLQSKGQIVFTGNGTLNVSGNKKNGIFSDDYIRIENGIINILKAEGDGIHADYFIMNGGILYIVNAMDDGIDGDEGHIEINGGSITIQSSAENAKAIHCDSTLTVNNGTINITVSGAASKGFKSEKNSIINNGIVNITTSGSTLLETSGNGYDPSYCTAIKSDADIFMNGGSFNCNSSGMGGKGISADGNIYVNGTRLQITTTGDGTTYTNSNGTKDSYTAACIKSDKNIYLLSGNITCSSSGTGGKGINAEGIISIGIQNMDNDSLILNVNTSGERFYVSGSTGGGMPNDNADYANPKAIKCLDNIEVYSGTLRIICSQSNEGGEGMESKDTLIINGGLIEIQTYDDCINAAKHIAITGGATYCNATNNDAIDCNGTLTISGGITIACGTTSPEEGFDCDQNTFKITGGVLIGTGGASSTPTSNQCSQRSILYTGTAGSAISIKNSSGTTILTYQMPSFLNSGGIGGPGGGSSMVLLFSSPDLISGTYTLYYGGNISGNDHFHGYYTNATYSGSNYKTFNASSMVTTVR